MGRRDDIPPEIEVIDLEGNIIAAGAIAEPDQAARPAGPQRSTGAWKKWAAGAAAALAVAALVGTLRDTDDSPPEVSEPFAIMALDNVDLEVGQADAAYPLFRRAWDHDLIVAGETILRVDLNTGATTQLATLGRGGALRSVVVIEGRVFVLSANGLQEVVDGTVGPLDVEVPNGGPELRLTGHYLYAVAADGSETTFTHLTTGTELRLGGANHFAGVGDDIYFEKGGSIGRISEDGEVESWAAGELLAIGPNHIAWRECPSFDDCRYWSGERTDPRSVRLDPSSETALALPRRLGSGFLATATLLSPKGRYAWTYDQSADVFEIGLGLVDLQSGSELALNGSSPPVLDPDETAVFVTGLDATIAIDGETGEVRRLALPGIGEAPFAFIPRS